MGFSFFDFGFSRGNEFKVYQIFEMDKKAVIKTLRKDFELVLFMNMQEKEPVYTGRQRIQLLWISAGKRSKLLYYRQELLNACKNGESPPQKENPVVEAMMTFNKESIPDSISIRHLNFNFTITLKKS